MFKTIKTTLRGAFAGLALVTASAGMSQAAALLFEADFSNGAGTNIATFQTPMGGGMISNFMLELSGVLFDTLYPTSGDLSYFPGDDDFSYTDFGRYTNSSAVAGVCGVGQCFLEIYPDNTGNPALPGDYLAIDAMLNNIDAGTLYTINPDPVSTIPLPAGGALLLSALAFGGLMVGRKKRQA